MEEDEIINGTNSGHSGGTPGSISHSSQEKEKIEREHNRPWVGNISALLENWMEFDFICEVRSPMSE